MPAIINSVEKNSIAFEIGLSRGDRVISLNGEKPKDFIDYKYLVCAENIELHIRKTDGNKEIVEIEKDFDEDLGITFECAVFDQIKPCCNKCIFCFVDQQPAGLRKSLYIKDDDYRLSYLQGTYITLTNLNEKDRKRIEQLKLGPLFVSVHTTNPDLRVKMLGNPHAKNIMEDLKWLNSLDIPIHTQIVLCPGFNDGEELEKTLKDLYKFKKNVLSVAIVPLGLTKYRQDNDLRRVDKHKAIEVISQTENFNKEIKRNFVSASDEFYVLAENNFPEKKYYNGFCQLDDGVGSSRLLLDDFSKYKKKLPKAISKKTKIAVATGQISANTMSLIADELNKIENLSVKIFGIKSNFWGEDVTVSGLLTGQDLIDTFKSLKGQFDLITIPSVMIRPYTESFLDDKTIAEVSKEIGHIKKIENYYSVKELVDIINSLSLRTTNGSEAIANMNDFEIASSHCSSQ
jgi:putative radical SAM enzyme (TIGR03279 family)